MTKGGNSKPTMLGRLIFGEKRKQHASPARHRSAVRSSRNGIDVPSAGGDHASKNPINVHDWAAWRTQLNEQMSNGATDQTDLKQMRQFLHGNSFYQQHSRNPSNGRYNGVRLLFSIPHAKLKPDFVDGAPRTLDTNMLDENHNRPNSADRNGTSMKSISPVSPLMKDKTISQLVPKHLLGNTGGFLYTNEQMVAADDALAHRAIRSPFTASDRVHSTLQKAVKDGNVLEKIKAFEMQAAAAAQAETAIKLSAAHGLNNRLPSTQASFHASPHRTLSPPRRQPLQQSISPMRLSHEPPHPYIRAHRSRNVHPVQQRRDGNSAPMMDRESRKGAHVLEPAHGDIILKRRTPSQKTANDDDYTITAMSSLAMSAGQGHRQQSHHRQHQHAHRPSASHSRHRSDLAHEKRSSNHRDSSHKKHQSKQKETSSKPVSSTTKTSTRRRWLKGRKESPSGAVTEKAKQDPPASKSTKNNKMKTKTNEQKKVEPVRKTTSISPRAKIPSLSTSDNNRVYGVPSAVVNEQPTSEAASPQLPARIEEENESDREEKNIEVKSLHQSPQEEEGGRDESSPDKRCETAVVTTVERRPSKAKYVKKISSTDGEILSKVEDDTRFSRPTDDHAHRSELNDEDEECKSEGDVFIEELSTSNIHSPQQPSTNLVPSQPSRSSADDPVPDRRWQWSKESGGLIDKGNRKKEPQPSLTLTLITRKNRSHPDEEPTVYEAPHSEQLSPPVKTTHPIKKTQSSHPFTTTVETDSNKQVSKQILHAIMNSMHHINTPPNQTNTDDFFENGPHTNPEETAVHLTPLS